MAVLDSGRERLSPAYERIADAIRERRCVILDGGVGSELSRSPVGPPDLDEHGWGMQALLDAPDTVLDVHRAYVAAGCDVISTDTWGLATAWRDGPAWGRGLAGGTVNWIELARRAIALARRAVEEGGGECALAFSLNGEIDSADGRETIRLLRRLFDDGSAPDLILLETLSVVRPSLLETVRELVATGIPVWLSFRRCPHGLCGVFGEHWGGPEGDAFGRSARSFEEVGVGAILVNCIPPDHVDGMVSFLRDFVDLPVGVYPNLGYYTNAGWQFDAGVGAAEYARMALRWRAEGAQIIGGCCGVRPEHIAAAREALAGTEPGTESRAPDPLGVRNRGGEAGTAVAEPWQDGRGRRLFPLEFPDISVEEGVRPPDQASFMVWRHIARERLGAHQRCLDVGCGSGLLAVQLALNGAGHVHAVDIDREAVANTLTNAYRNRVEDRVSASEVDVYPWTPEERFDLIVASLDQWPEDPFAAASTHRRGDYWGRGLVDQVITKLEDALAPDGVAYLVQLSILSQQRTAELLAERGFQARVADFAVYPFGAGEETRHEQIEWVEKLSDAYHLRLGRTEALVAYLLEITGAAA